MSTETLRILVEAVTLILGELEETPHFPGRPFEPYPKEGWQNVRAALFDAAESEGVID